MFQITKVVQKTKSGISFIMDESMVEYIDNKTVFVLDPITHPDGDLTLILEEQSFWYICKLCLQNKLSFINLIL